MSPTVLPARVDVDELLNALAVEAALHFGGADAHPEFVKLFIRAFQSQKVAIVSAIHMGVMGEILDHG